MARIVEGIKELLKGKDDDDHKYRYHYDQRGAPGSKRYDGYPTNASPKGRNGYLADGRSGYPAEGRSGYPAEGRSGYPAEGRSGYPAEGRSGYPAEGRSGYPVEGRSGYPAEGRSGYPAEGRSGYPVEGRSGYPVTTTVDGRSGYATNSIPDRRSGYPVTATVNGRSGYSANSIPEVRNSYPPEGRSAYATEGRNGYPVSATADGRSGYSIEGRGGYPSDGRSGYPVSATAGGYRAPLGRQTVDDNYVRSSYDTRSEARGEYHHPYTSSTRGSEYDQAYGIRDASPHIGSEYRASPRGSLSGRPTLARMPSFGSGKVTQYDGVGPRGQDYEAKDYSGFRRMPSFGKSRHHEAEYISNYDEPRSSSHRELNAPIRRIPSFNRSRYHDAEYMAADDDRDYSPHSFHDNGSSYTASYNDRPNLLSQVSFSKMPVENPNYVKQIANY